MARPNKKTIGIIKGIVDDYKEVSFREVTMEVEEDCSVNIYAEDNESFSGVLLNDLSKAAELFNCTWVVRYWRGKMQIHIF